MSSWWAVAGDAHTDLGGLYITYVFSPIQWTSWWQVTNITNHVFEWSRSFVDVSFHSFYASSERSLLINAVCPQHRSNCRCRVSEASVCIHMSLCECYTRLESYSSSSYLSQSYIPKEYGIWLIWPIAQPHETINLRGSYGNHGILKGFKAFSDRCFFLQKMAGHDAILRFVKAGVMPNDVLCRV